METLFTIENLIALLTLTSLEVVLGIDNIVFIAILTAKLPPEHRAKARNIGLSLAMIMRIILLLGISWIMGLTRELFAFFNHAVTGKDLILLCGGLFLVGKATFEIHEKLEGHEVPFDGESPKAQVSFAAIISQILLLDLVFSLDSVITAVGMVDTIPVMIAAVVIAIGVMLAFAGRISEFIEKHPTLKMLALAFLILIGVMLFVEGLGTHVNKGYIYFAMAFSLAVELLNMRFRRVTARVRGVPAMPRQEARPNRIAAE